MNQGNSNSWWFILHGAWQSMNRESSLGREPASELSGVHLPSCASGMGVCKNIKLRIGCSTEEVPSSFSCQPASH